MTNLLAVLCVVVWLTMVKRAVPGGAPEVALSRPEIDVLDRMAGGPPPVAERTASHYLLQIAKLGGYLARTKERPGQHLPRLKQNSV